MKTSKKLKLKNIISSNPLNNGIIIECYIDNSGQFKVPDNVIAIMGATNDINFVTGQQTVKLKKNEVLVNKSKSGLSGNR